VPGGKEGDSDTDDRLGLRRIHQGNPQISPAVGHLELGVGRPGQGVVVVGKHGDKNKRGQQASVVSGLLGVDACGCQGDSSGCVPGRLGRSNLVKPQRHRSAGCGTGVRGTDRAGHGAHTVLDLTYWTVLQGGTRVDRRPGAEAARRRGGAERGTQDCLGFMGRAWASSIDDRDRGWPSILRAGCDRLGDAEISQPKTVECSNIFLQVFGN